MGFSPLSAVSLDPRLRVHLQRHQIIWKGYVCHGNITLPFYVDSTY